MRTLRKIAFLLEEFSTFAPSPSQHLLDRFLMGYPRDGQFHQPNVAGVSAYLLLTSEDDFGARRNDFGLRVERTAEPAVEGADGVVIVSRPPGAMANDRFLQTALRLAPEGAACFVHGALSSTLEKATEAVRLADSRRISLLAGTPVSLTWRLPELELPPGTALAESLIVVQRNSFGSPGMLSGAELNALEGLLPIIERRQGGESGVRSLRLLEGIDVWRAGDRRLWSWPLLASALSRSDSPQGDPVLDGRTQDLVGLGLVPKLARNPFAWLIEHQDGLRTTLLVLDGVVGDCNFAVRARDGRVFSAQLFRAPAPGEHHFSQLAAAIEDFFRGGKPPWPVQRNVLIAGLLQAFRNPATRREKGTPTPELKLAYTV